MHTEMWFDAKCLGKFAAKFYHVTAPCVNFGVWLPSLSCILAIPSFIFKQFNATSFLQCTQLFDSYCN